ncbi:IS30 family transposase, partial [Vagococcus silagei]
MTQTKTITKTTKGKHLSLKERISIENWNQDGYSNREIAKRLGRAPQTINNEIKRGMTPQARQQKQNGKVYRYFRNEYSADVAETKYHENRENSGRRMKWTYFPDMLEKLDELMIGKNHFSPDVALFLLRKSGDFLASELPTTSTLYSWINKGFLKTKNIDLLCKMSRKPKQKKVRKNKTNLGTSIDERPQEVNGRKTFGHWEIDTVVGSLERKEPVMLTLTERLTRFELIFKVEGKNPKAIGKSLSRLIENLGDNFSKIFQSITSDNG